MASASSSTGIQLSELAASEDELLDATPLDVKGLLEGCLWYHGPLSRHIANSLLMQNGSEGTYLLRERVLKGSGSTGIGRLCLSVRTSDAVKHFDVGWDGRAYILGEATLHSIDELVEHFGKKPIMGTDDVRTKLCFPYPRHIEEFASYEKVRVSTGWGAKQFGGDSTTPTPSLSTASHEGYLTKLGGVHKNWNTRWFVLWKNELKYYRHREDKHPVKILDLSQCSHVAETDKKGKDNCFMICMPTRTYYAYAETREAMQQWVDILRTEVGRAKKGKQCPISGGGDP